MPDFDLKMRLMLNLGLQSLRPKGAGLIFPKLDLNRHLVSLIEMQAFLASKNTAIINFESSANGAGRVEDIGKNYINILICFNGFN